MLAAMLYGTYVLFGMLTYIGASFTWFFVPEAKRFTLELDVTFGSEGTAQADRETMEEINIEIGLTRMFRGDLGGLGVRWLRLRRIMGGAYGDLYLISSGAMVRPTPLVAVL